MYEFLEKSEVDFEESFVFEDGKLKTQQGGTINLVLYSLAETLTGLKDFDDRDIYVSGFDWEQNVESFGDINIQWYYNTGISVAENDLVKIDYSRLLTESNFIGQQIIINGTWQLFMGIDFHPDHSRIVNGGHLFIYYKKKS